MGYPQLGSVILPAPVLEEPNDRERVEEKYQVRTPGGRLRTQILSYAYVYHMTFKFASLTTYYAVETALDAARLVGTHLVFTYDRWSSSAAGVAVEVDLSSAEKAQPDDIDPLACHFTLTLTEVEGR